jgi:hypothetical protein
LIVRGTPVLDMNGFGFTGGVYLNMINFLGEKILKGAEQIFFLGYLNSTSQPEQGP